MDPSKAELVPMLLWWFAAIAPLLYFNFRQPSSGLVAAYCFQMWLLHWLGALVHAFPWSDLPESEVVALGFQQATYGIIAFAIGATLLGPAIGRKIFARQHAESEGPLNPKLPRKYIIVGAISFFVLAPTIGQYPGLNAVPAVGQQLVVIGCCLRCWLAWHTGGKTALTRTLIPTMLIPMIILLRQGFLGYGVIAISIILLFTARFFRPRWILLVGFLVCAYFGLTGYVTYMRDRDDIRATVWGQAPIADRLAQAWTTVSTFDWFSPDDDAQLTLIDGRLNQNVLIGEAVDHLSSTGQYMNGSTIVEAVLAMIPRLIWPDKPMAAGSGLLVTNLTGIQFGATTSVGIGPVMEFYGNFATAGVLMGFFVVGAIVGGLDFCSGMHLDAGNWKSFMATFLVGIACLNVAGSLVEITAGAAASVVVANVVNRFVKQRAHAPDPALEAAA